MFSVPLKCGNCRHLVDFSFQHVSEYSARSPEEVKKLGLPNRGIDVSVAIKTLHDSDKVSASAHAHCPRCRQPTLIVFDCRRVALEGISKVVKANEGNLLGGASLVNVIKYYPAPPVPDQSPFWPESLRRLFADAQDMVSEGKSPAIILATARSVLELALKELDDQPTLNLYQRIEHLHKAGIITSAVKDWAHDIRLEGNAGTHSGTGEEGSAAEYVEFLKLFLDMTFSLPERIREKRKAD